MALRLIKDGVPHAVKKSEQQERKELRVAATRLIEAATENLDGRSILLHYKNIVINDVTVEGEWLVEVRRTY